MGWEYGIKTGGCNLALLADCLQINQRGETNGGCQWAGGRGRWRLPRNVRYRVRHHWCVSMRVCVAH